MLTSPQNLLPRINLKLCISSLDGEEIKPGLKQRLSKAFQGSTAKKYINKWAHKGRKEGRKAERLRCMFSTFDSVS